MVKHHASKTWLPPREAGKAPQETKDEASKVTKAQAWQTPEVSKDEAPKVTNDQVPKVSNGQPPKVTKDQAPKVSGRVVMARLDKANLELKKMEEKQDLFDSGVKKEQID